MAVNMNGNPKTGTGFTNLQKLIGANQQNKLGSTIKQGVSNSVNQVNAGVNQAKQDFGTQLGQSQQALQANQSKVSSLLQDPTKATDQDINDVSKIRAGTYTGPQGINDVSKLQAQAQSVQGLVNNGNSSLLQRYAGGNQYTAGQRRLDGAILNQTGAKDLQEARRTAATVDQNIGGLQNTAQQQAQALQNQYQQYGQDVTKQLGDAQSAVNSQYDTKAADIQAKEATKSATFGQLRQLLSGDRSALTGITNGNTATQVQDQAVKQIKDLIRSTPGLSDTLSEDTINSTVQKARTLGMDPLTLLNNTLQTNNAVNADRAGVMSAADAAKVNALSKLSGGTDMYDPTAVGQYKEGGTSLAQSDINNELYKGTGALRTTGDNLLNSREAFFNAQGAGGNGTIDSRLNDITSQLSKYDSLGLDLSNDEGYQQLKKLQQVYSDPASRQALTNASGFSQTGAANAGDQLRRLYAQYGLI